MLSFAALCQREVNALLEAIRFFTRLPAPVWGEFSPAYSARAARYLPWVGFLVGGLAAGVAWGATALWPMPVVALLAMAVCIGVTGAFHEDGLCDTADGLGGGWDRQRILAIMKDSRVGSYGVIAVVMALLGKFVLLSQSTPMLLPLVLLAGQVVSRAFAVSVMGCLPYARLESEGGEAKVQALATPLGGDGWLLLFGAAAVALYPLARILPWQQWGLALLLALLVTLWLARLCYRWLGGYTGDCLGAVQQVSECAFYLGCSAQIVAGG